MEKVVYSVPITPAGQGESAIYRDPFVAQSDLISTYNGITTIQELVEQAFKQFQDNDFLGTRNQTTGKYEFITYKQTQERALALGAALDKQGLVPAKNEYQDYSLRMIGIFAKNREEWAVTDIANALYGYTMVPLYDTLGPDSISYVLFNSQIESCYCGAAGVTTISKTKDLHKLKNLIVFDQITDAELIKTIQERGLKIIQYQELVERGQAVVSTVERRRVKPDDILSLCYTSGTTGNPQGAMMSHQNFLGCVINTIYSDFQVYEGDVHLSFLPLPHAYERCSFWNFCLHGATVGYYSGDILQLTEDLQALRPTILLVVPRLLNQFYDGFQYKIQNSPPHIKKRFDQALDEKIKNLKTKSVYTHPVWDSILLSDFRFFFGGRVRIMVTGSAPIAQEVLDFMKTAMSCPIIQGYGQTQSSAASFLTSIQDPEAGHVGGVKPSLELKVVDVPDMNYLSTDKDSEGRLLPRGEVCTRGSSIIPGYYKDPEKSKEAIDEDGWLHSGDIGAILPNGALKIVDRKKNIFKLSQGEYVAPEKLQNVYIRCTGVAEVFVHGDSLQSFLVGVIVPNEPVFMKVAESVGIKGLSLKELCNDPQFNETMLKLLEKHGRENGLQGFEILRRVHFEPVSLAVHGCFTSTMKLQRHIAAKVFEAQIKQMYSS